jgi:hypothetical protein
VIIVEEEIYKHKKELIMSIVFFILGAVVGAYLLISSPPDFSNYNAAVNITASILFVILSGFCIGGIPIAWMRLPKLPFVLGGDASWAFLGLFINFCYHLFGACLLGWLYMAIYFIRDIFFLVRHKND